MGSHNFFLSFLLSGHPPPPPPPSGRTTRKIEVYHKTALLFANVLRCIHLFKKNSLIVTI